LRSESGDRDPLGAWLLPRLACADLATSAGSQAKKRQEVPKLLIPFMIRLSGRQEFSQCPPQPLRGWQDFWVLLAMLEALKTYDL